MVEKTDSATATGHPSCLCSQLHNLVLHRFDAMDAFFSRLFRDYPHFMREHFSKFRCCNECVNPADWPLLAQAQPTNYVPPPPTPAHPGTQRPRRNGVNESSPSTSTATASTLAISNQNGDVVVQEDDIEVDPGKAKKLVEQTPAPSQPPVVEMLVETAPEVIPRPCSVIRHVSSDSLASLAAPPEPSPVISPCSSVSPSPDPAPTSAANDNSVDDDAPLLPSAQISSNVDSSTFNQNQPSLPEDDEQSMDSTDTELASASENAATINDTCEDEDTSSSTVPESNLADQVVENEPGSKTEATEENMELNEIKSELDNCEMPNTAPPSNTPTSTATNRSIQPNGQDSLKETAQDDVDIIDLTFDEDEEVTPRESHVNDEVVIPPVSHADDEEVTPPVSHADDEEVTPPVSHADGEEVTPPVSHSDDEDVTLPESSVKESRKRKLAGCTSAVRVIPDKPNEPNWKHWKKNIATPFIKGNSTVFLGKGTQIGAPPPKKRQHTLSDPLPSPPPTRRERRPTLMPPKLKRKNDDSSDTSSVESAEDVEQDDDEDIENGIIPALYPDVELRENQSQDNRPPSVSDTDDCVVLDDDSQQPEEIQLLAAPILNVQSIPTRTPVQSSSAELSNVVVPSGPPSEGSQKSDASSEETFVDDRVSSDVSNSSSGEGQESEDPEIIIVDENIPSTSAAAIPLPNDNSVQMSPNTTQINQRNSDRAAENQKGALSHPPSIQQPINKDHSNFSEYRRQSVLGSSGKKTDAILQNQNESSLSCDDEDTDNGSQKDQDPQMPVLRLPIPVSPSNENGNANIGAPALVFHPGDRVRSLNENDLARMDASEQLMNTEEDRDMGGVGGDEKSDDEAERPHVVQRRSRRKRKKSIKLNGFANEEPQRMNGYGETDDEGFRNQADETLEVDVVCNTEEENNETSRSNRKKRSASKDQRWFHSEHKNFATLTIRRGKLQENFDWRQARQADFPLTQQSKKRGRSKKQRRPDTDTEGGWRGPNLRQSRSRLHAVTDFYFSSNDDEPLINKKVRTQSLSATGPRSGDNNQMLRHAENDNAERDLPDRQPIAGPSKTFYQSLPQQSNGTSGLGVHVISLSGDDDDDDGYVEDRWSQSAETGYGHGQPSNPANVSVYTDRLSGVEDPDATTIVEFQSEHGSQASTTTTAASLSSTPGSVSRRQLKRGIAVECPKCHREVSNHFLKRHQKSHKCDRDRSPRPVGGAMTDYENDNDSQTEAELDDEMPSVDHHQQQKRKRGRPPGSKMGQCTFCFKKMLLRNVRDHVLNNVCAESRAAVANGDQLEYYSQDDSQTEDEGWDHNEIEYANGGGSLVPTRIPSPIPVVRINCPGCGLSMLKTSLRNHLKQNRCRGRSTPSITAAETISTSPTTTTSTTTSTTSSFTSTTNIRPNTTNQNDDGVEGSGSGTGDGEQSQGYLTNKRERSCRRVAKYKYNCDEDDDVGSNIETEYDGYDRVVSSPLPPEQQSTFDDCPYADCSYVPVDEKDYLYHSNEEHPQGEGYSCNSCKRVYIHRLNLEAHQKTHVPRFPFDATMVSYIKNPALQPSVVISIDEFLASRQALQH